MSELGRWTMGALAALVLGQAALPAGAYDAEPLPYPIPPACSAVVLPMEVEEWVEASEAEVAVEGTVNVEPTKQMQARQELIDAIRSLVKEEPPDRRWRWTSVRMDRDSSGLSRFVGTAEIRVPEAQIDALWEQAKARSRPGMALRVATVRWEPSTADRQTAMAHGRERLYRLARQEAARVSHEIGDEWRIERIFFERSLPHLQASLAPTVACQSLSDEQTQYKAKNEALMRADRLRLSAYVVLSRPGCTSRNGR